MKRHFVPKPFTNSAKAILTGSIAALLATHLAAQTTITYTNGQTDTTAYSISAPNDPTTLTISTGVATQSGILSGTGSLIKTGAGKLTLLGFNTFAGPVQLNAGTLNIFHDSNLGAAGNAVTLAGGTLQSSSTYSSHPLAISSASTIDVAQGFTTLQNAALTGSGTLTKTGGGTFFLGAGSGNTFSGDITLAVNGGTFQVGSSVSSSTAGGATLPSLTSANTITVNRGATFSIQDLGTNGGGYIADRLGSAGNRPAVSMSGGTFNLSGASNAAVMTQTLGALTLASGTSTISVSRNGAGTPESIFSSLSRNSGAFVNFAGTSLGTAATNAPQILFTSAPTLVGGGGAAGSTTISIVPGAGYNGSGFTLDLVTYGANGIRALTTAEYNAVAGNDINGAGATENVKISNATPTFPALTAPRTVNSLVNTAAANATWAMGNTLTITSGQFLHAKLGNSLNISSGVLTAGTGAASMVDLDMTISDTVTLGANVNDNGSTSVALVKNGFATLNLNNTIDNTYSGGTYVNDGFMTTGPTANRRYLGTGVVVVNGSGSLTLGAIGATSFSGSVGSPTYTVKTGGEVFPAGAIPAANEFFKIESGAVLTNRGTTSAGGLNISGGTKNLDAAFGAVLAETVAGANVAIKNGAGVITSLTTPTYYFGLATSLSENVTVGAGTPWLGISTDRFGGTYAGATNNTITANSDFSLQGLAVPGGGAPSFIILSLGNGASPTNIIKIATPNGGMNANIVGSVSLNNDNCQYGSAGNTVTFQVTPGATLSANTATAMGVVVGAAIAPASIVVQNGGTLTIGNAAAINGNVTILPGGMFTQNQNTLTGTGTFTHSNGSILNLPAGGSTAVVSGAAQALGTVPGTIVRMGINGLLPGTSAGGVTQFDSRLNNAAVYELKNFSTVTMGAAAAATDSLFTLSASGGIGGVLTNDATDGGLGNATGLVAIGSGGGTFAATTGTTLTVTENFALGSNTLSIGSAQSYDGNPKLGTVFVNSPSGSNIGSAGSVISVLNGATLMLGFAGQIPDAARLTVNTGGTVNLFSNSDTMESLTGAGTITNTGNLATLMVSPTTTDANFSGVLSATFNPANLILTKTGTGTQTLSGANTYAGATTVSAGVLRLNGATSLPGGIDTTVGANESALTLNGGVLGLGAGNFTRALGTGPGQVQFTADGGGFAAYTADRLVNLGGATVAVTWASGNFVPAGGSLILGATDATHTVTFQNPINFNAATRTMQVDNGAATVDAIFSGTLSNGGLTKTGAGTLQVMGANTYAGQTTVSAGTLKAGVVSVANVSGAFGNNSAVTMANVAGATLDITGFNTQIGSLTGGGTTGGNVTLGAATLTVGGDNTSPAAYAGILSGTGGGLTKIGTGRLTLSGTNTYTGTTTVSGGTLEAAAAGALGGTNGVTVNTGGTLLLSNTGTTDRINNSATVTLAGGMFNTSGLSETVGALTLSLSSIIDMGVGGNSILHFADSSALTWTGTLSIWNWSGNPYTGGGTDQVFFGNGSGAGLTASQLSKVKFYSDAGTTVLPSPPGFSAFTGSFGEVAPVPEPSSFFVAIGLFGLIVARERNATRTTPTKK